MTQTTFTIFPSLLLAEDIRLTQYRLAGYLPPAARIGAEFRLENLQRQLKKGQR